MRIGATIFNQNYRDWDRYEAEEKGDKVPQRAVRPGSNEGPDYSGELTG